MDIGARHDPWDGFQSNYKGKSSSCMHLVKPSNKRKPNRLLLFWRWGDLGLNCMQWIKKSLSKL